MSLSYGQKDCKNRKKREHYYKKGKHMKQYFSRTEQLLGKQAMDRLYQAKVAVFGIGGVGSFAVEALARSGVGHLVLVDKDIVSQTNINRQLIATTKTIGRYKTEVMQERISEINPETVVEEYKCFYGIETTSLFDFSSFDYIVDAIDTISSKIILIEQAKKAGIPIISCMGAGNKLDPTQFTVADISQTTVCPLAKVMRKELKNRAIENVKVVYSKEPPITPAKSNETVAKGKHQIPGSVAFVPSVAGLILAGEVIKDITGIS